jgi:hypothetical protein
MDWAGGWCWLDRYEREDLASEVLSFREQAMSKRSQLAEWISHPVEKFGVVMVFDPAL